ncbi:MAG: hypothetical protein J0M01_11990 [Dechloromonas sp.]|jgi:hypothetical protein|nr:hypothetical protein [Dechloromonas sp.]
MNGGLGGSGGKVIREIRKIFVSNGALNYEQNDARFEFLYVDTSTDELDKDSLWSVLGRDIQLERSQIIVNKSGAVRPVLEDPASYPGLKGWIKPTSVFDFVSPTTAGAAQKRKLGRLVFAQNVATFVKAYRLRSLWRSTAEEILRVCSIRSRNPTSKRSSTRKCPGPSNQAIPISRRRRS